MLNLIFRRANLQKGDLDRYHSKPIDTTSKRAEGEIASVAGATIKTMFGMVWKAVKTLFFIVMITGLTVFISVATYIWSFKDITPPNIGTLSLNYTSFVHIDDGTGTGATKEYLALYNPSENRVWVDLKDIPQTMIDAIVAIEDKRFFEHNGVDWWTTMGAVGRLAGIGDDRGGGGSTITQQLIKNVTGEDDVSIIRKIQEIFMALNLEKKYYKDDIIELYLNVVSFGSNTKGVQAASNLYFGHDIKDADIAECASIAGITQYPYLYTPLYFPDKNKERQEIVLEAMYDQGKITAAEYNEALAKAQNMPFVDYSDESETQEIKAPGTVWNWYIETMIYDVAADLMEVNNWSWETAIYNIYNSGYTIYCSMDEGMQEGVEDLFMNNPEIVPADLEVQYGIYAMDYHGKTLAVVGSRQKKTGNMVSNHATRSRRQPGSSIKPLSVYAPALENGYITYGSVLKDQKIEDYFGKGKPGPDNFSKSNESYMNVDKAIRISQNMPAAQLVDEMGVETSYKFLEEKLHFEGLDKDNDMSLGPLSLGGFYKGPTVRELTAGYQIFGNGGIYNKPYTYFYVRDHDNNVILDNRDKYGEQAISEENAAVMNKLLHEPIYGPQGTASWPGRGGVQIEGLDIFGKTGTADSYYNLTFVGGTPFALAGIWNGVADRQVSLSDQDSAKVMWKALMQYLYANYDFRNVDSGYYISDNVVTETYCRNSGLLAGRNCYNTAEGLYANVDGGVPDVCNGGSDHVHGAKKPKDEDEDNSGSDGEQTPVPNTDSESSTPSSSGSSSTPSENTGSDPNNTSGGGSSSGGNPSGGSSGGEDPNGGTSGGGDPSGGTSGGGDPNGGTSGGEDPNGGGTVVGGGGEDEVIEYFQPNIPGL